MLKVRAFYFYTLAGSLRTLQFVTTGAKLAQVVYALSNARGELRNLLSQNIMQLKSCRIYAESLIAILDRIMATSYAEDEIVLDDLASMWGALNNFEIAFNAETSTAELYVVIRKGAFNISDLVDNAELVFHPDLLKKVPRAADDIRAMGRCLAFSLGTAAGFHMLRAHETVLLAYLHLKSGGKPPPANRNLGTYIKELENCGPDRKVISVLHQIKDLHRNPLFHPEENLTVDEAIDLLGIVRSAISLMIAPLPIFVI